MQNRRYFLCVFSGERRQAPGERGAGLTRAPRARAERGGGGGGGYSREPGQGPSLIPKQADTVISLLKSL